MALVNDATEADTRTRVLIEAERLFRAIGYQKTTVADIAKGLQMSPGNVYRFFDSKRAIYEAVARSLLQQVEAEVAAVASNGKPPRERLREVLKTIHQLNAERFVGDEKIHEMVAMAITEDWDVADVHIERLGQIIGGVIAEGVASGDFAECDIPLSAACICAAMLRFFHPQMIEQCKGKPGPDLEQMIDFLLGGLGASAR